MTDLRVLCRLAAHVFPQVGVEFSCRDDAVFITVCFAAAGASIGHLLGEGKEYEVRYPGGTTRPVMYRNQRTGSDDLLSIERPRTESPWSIPA